MTVTPRFNENDVGRMPSEIADLMPAVAERLLGEPNKALSQGDELRFGTHGSLAVDTAKGVWHDHEANEGGGVIDLVRRETGKANGAAMDWLKGEGLVEEPTSRKPKIIGAYDYHDADGRLLSQVVRFAPKDFRQRKPDGRGGWDWKVKGVKRVPYRLPQVIEAVEAGMTIYIPEGEKDCNRLADLGLAATCNAGGAGKWTDEHSKFLNGAHVVLLPDNDDAGRSHVEAAASSLKAAGAASVKVLALPGLPEKGDVSDWLAKGGLADELAKLAESASDVQATQSQPTFTPQEIEVTEDGVARAFTATYGETMRFDHDDGRWYQWVGDHWKPNSTGLAYSYSRILAREASEGKNAATVAVMRRAGFAGGVERMARTDPTHAVTHNAWDANPMLAGCPGMTIDLKTGKARSAAPKDNITKMLGVAPAETADCPIWLRFLNDATMNDAEMIRFLQQWFGYSLTGDTREHALVFIYGPGGNGKSVFLNILMRVLGDYAVTASMDTFTASRSDKHPTDLAMLKGARLVSASETEEGRAWAESRIKSLTGGDPITARRMRQDFFTFVPQFKLAVVGNHKPALHNVDDAARRRFRIVPFIHKPAHPDKELEEKLAAELPGILRWALEGLADWRANGLITPSAVTAATDEYFNDQDMFGQWLADECRAEPTNIHLWSARKDLFSSWTDYAKRNGEEAGTSRKFCALMRGKGFGDQKKGKERAFVGVMLNQPEKSYHD